MNKKVECEEMNKKQFEQQIRELADRDSVIYPEGYEEYIQNILGKLSDSGGGKTKRKRRYYWKKWVPAAILGIGLLVGLPAGAMVHGYFERMEKMNHQEQQKYVCDLEKSVADGDSFSRELTKKERERKELLREAYEAGKRYPEKTLYQITDKKQIDNDRVCFLPDNSMFYLPKRSLTDEELLQIIDFYYKRDYSLTQNHENNRVDKEKESGQCTDGVVDRKVLKKKADIWLQKMFQKDLSDSAKQIHTIPDADGKTMYYTVTVQNPDAQLEYNVEFDVDSLELVSASVEDYRKDYIQQDVPFMRKKMKVAYKQANYMVQQLSGDAVISKSTCEFFSLESGNIAYGVLKFVYEKEDGTGCIVHYSVPGNICYQITVSDNVKKYRKMSRTGGKNRDLQYTVIDLSAFPQSD